MHDAFASEIIRWLWLIWIVNWVISGFFVKDPVRSEPAPSRVAHLSLFGLGIGLIYAPGLQLGILERHFLIPSAALDAVSVLLTIVGLVLASWARVHIGQYWSASVTLKTDHRVIQTGPYAYMRHPIYTGILTAFLGASLVNGQYRGVLGFAVAVAAILLKARREEYLLMQAFGPAYADYRQHTGLLLPKIY